jgi:hypothetical protein
MLNRQQQNWHLNFRLVPKAKYFQIYLLMRGPTMRSYGTKVAIVSSIETANTHTMTYNAWP